MFTVKQKFKHMEKHLFLILLIAAFGGLIAVVVMNNKKVQPAQSPVQLPDDVEIYYMGGNPIPVDFGTMAKNEPQPYGNKR